MEAKNDNDIENNNKEEIKEDKKEEQKEENKEKDKIENKEDNKEKNQENNKNDNKENNEEYKDENKDDNKENNKIENNNVYKDEIKIENEKENKKQNKLEDNEGNKDEITSENQDVNKEGNKDNNKIQNKKENNEEKKEKQNIENEDKSKERKGIFKEDNKLDNKEENKEVLDNQKEIENKDDINNENAKNDKSNIYSNLYSSPGFQEINSENEIDKIALGLNGRQRSLININDIEIEEKKEEQEQEENKKEEEEKENLNENNILGNIFRSVVKIKSKQPKENLRISLYRINLDNEPKDFGSIIKAKLNEIKQYTLNFFDKSIKEFDKRYNEYIEKINKYINENEFKMSKLLENQLDQIENENILDFAENQIFEKIENIFEIHQNIFDSIEEHIGLLKLLLDQINLIQQKNPLECYINNNSSEILNSWFLYKLDYQKLNLSNILKNKYLSDLCSQYLGKKEEHNFSSITINKDNKRILPLESSFLKENLKNVKKMQFIQLKSGEINSLFKVTNSKANINESQIKFDDGYTSAEKLSSLTLINSDLSSSDLNKISSPSLIKLKIKRNNLSLNLKSFVGNILDKALSLQKLYLQNCSIDNQSLSEALEFLSDSPKILESLQFLSFSENDITKVDLTNNLIKKQCEFKSLKFIDCSKNNIYDFSQENFQAFPQLKVLDLTNNNMSNHLFFDNIRKIPDNIALLSNNLFLNNNQDNAGDYRKYLNNKLMKFSHKIEKLDLSLLYNRKMLNQLIELKLSPMVKISLIKLNLSYCGLDNTTTYKFLQNNFGLLNLKEINLSNNFINIEIFDLILKDEIPLDNLYSIDLSMNSINSVNLDNYKKLELFIQFYSKLIKIKLQGTEFLQQLLLLFSHKDLEEEIEQINQRIYNKGFKFIVGAENWLTIEPLKSLFEIKDKEMDSY